MQYGNFPRYRRWLEFESPEDFSRYTKTKDRIPEWAMRIEGRQEEFRKLIDGKAPEQEIHDFLEENPYFLPGFSDLHHGPYEGIIATKLPLGKSFVTDFAYIASNSQTLYFTCVEIESARKRLFRADGRFHRDYLDSRQQIADWLFWASHNSREAIDCWGSLFNGRPASWYEIAFRGFLVFGRRHELDTRAKHERWSAEAASLHAGLRTMTYDRLLGASDYIGLDIDNHRLAVCAYRDRRFVVKRVVS